MLMAGCVLSVTCVAREGFCQRVDSETEEARKRFLEGVRRYDEQDYEAARLAFLQAYLLKSHPTVLLNLAMSEMRADRPAEAAAHLSKYVRENPEAPALANAQASLVEVRARVAELEVTVNRDDSVVAVDGVEVGRSPLGESLFVMPGTRQLSARQGALSAVETLQLGAGERRQVRLELPLELPHPTAPSRDTSPFTASLSPPPASTSMPDSGSKGFFQWLGGSPGALATITVAGLSLGTSAVLAGLASERFSSADEISGVIADQIQVHTEAGFLTGAAIACGADGLAGGVGPFSARTPAETVSILVSDYASACTLAEDRHDAAEQLQTLSLVSLAVGVAATVGTVVWYFADRSSDSPPSAASTRKPRASLEATLAPGAQSLRFRLEF